jgi:hypothetical protein
MITKLRRQGAADGRAASSRIDRVEAVVTWMATTMVKALGGPDQVLRNVGNREDALEVLRAAGIDTGPVVARWDAEQREREGKVPKQVTTHYDDLVNDLRHDPRVTSAIMAGAGNNELRQIISQVSAEYAARIKAEAAEADRRTNFMWTDAKTGRPVYGDAVAVPLGAPIDPFTGAPHQKTLAVNESVPPLGSEPISAPDMRDVRVVATTCTEHAGAAGDRYCATCGRPRPA